MSECDTMGNYYKDGRFLYPNRINTSDGYITLEWTNKRLTKYKKYNSSNVLQYEITYTYDINGLRLSKVYKEGTKEDKVEYYYDLQLLVGEKRTYSTGLVENYKYYYDSNRQVECFSINEVMYFYLRDTKQDICAIIDSQGNIVSSYVYDAYGNILNSLSGIGNKNPFRYKGYYYDEETQLYWVSSRYYSPELCRFISPDSIEYLDPQSINGLNLYCYCYNDPINYYDPSGHSAWLIIGLLAGSLALGFVASVVGQGFSHGWNEINYWQAGLDGVIALGTTALSFTGIPAWGMALVGAGTGFGQYAMDCGFHNEQMTWLGAGTATVLGGVFGFAGGPGVRNNGAIAKNMVGLSDDGARAIGAIATATNRSFLGEISEKGMQATLNLYSRTAFNAVQAAIPGTIRHLMIKSIAPGIILPIANLITSIGIGHVYKRLGWC